MSGKSAFIRNLYYSSVGTYIEFLIGLVISVILARSLGSEVYGVYALMMWLSALSIFAINGGVKSSATKFVSEACERKDKPLEHAIIRYLKKIQLLSGIVVMLLFALVFLFYGEDIVPEGVVPLLYVVLIASMLRALYMFNVAIAQGREAFDKTARTLMIVTPIYLAMVIFVSVFEYGLTGFLVAYLFSGIIYFVVMWSHIQERDKVEVVTLGQELKARINKHTKIVKINVLLSFLVTKQLEIFFLNFFSSSKDIAYFNVAFLLANSAMAVVPGVATSLLMPIMSRAVMSNDRDVVPKKFLRTTRFLVFLSVPVAIFLILFAKDVVLLLFGSEYQNSVFPLQVLVVVAALLTIINAAISYQFSSDQQGQVLKITIFSLFVNVVVDVYLIYHYQLMGAVAGYAISGVTMASLLLWSACRSLNISLEYKAYAKLIVAGVLGAVPIALLQLYVPVFILIVPAVFLFVILYIALTILLRFWDKGDLSYIQVTLAEKGGKLAPIEKMLSRLVKVSYR